MAEVHLLVQIVDAALAEAARKAGPWLVCRPGCWECCIGPFPISHEDAARLRAGLAELELHDAARAARIREKARGEQGEEDPCPALDPITHTCDLYAARPLTCRTFGPPIHGPLEAAGVCELCFQGASDEEIAACAVVVEGLDDLPEETTVAEALGR
jgi:Fe-S-cluster containining protein